MLGRTTAFIACLIIADAAWSMVISSYSVQPSACGAATGSISVTVVGGTPPYTYQWSNGATTADIYGLSPGVYDLTVTDAGGGQISDSWTVPTEELYISESGQYGHFACPGDSFGEVQVNENDIGGTPPYSYSPPPYTYDSEGDPVFYYYNTAPGTWVQIQVTDANGCPGTATEMIVGAQVDSGPLMVVDNITGSCTGGAGGSVTISNINEENGWLFPTCTLLDTNEMILVYFDYPPNTLTLPDLQPGNYHFVRSWDPEAMAHSCDGNPFDRVDFSIPDLGPDCGSVSGTVYIDNDQDCVQDPGEPGVPFQVLEILPGPAYAITGNDGHYAFDIPDGAYSLGQTDPTLIQLCPATAPVPFTVASNQAVIHLADSSTVPMDLSAQLEQTAMRPGFNGYLWGSVRNLSPQVTGAVTVTLDLDAALVYVEATPAPTSVAGNTLVWELPAFPAYQQQVFGVSVQVPAATPLGTPLSSTLMASNTLPEANTANNSATANSQVTGSYDPNVKQARTSTGYSSTQYFIGVDDHIDYTIQFQNTGTDTAFTVVVTDTLGETLDQSTFQQGVASHPFNVAFKPGRLVEWTFTNILLPDSGTNEAASHGLVSFRIRPKLPLLPGTAITNSANIYFDFNEPVITEPCVLTAEIGTGVAGTDAERIHLMPNPTDDILDVQLPEGSTTAFDLLSMDGRHLVVPTVWRSGGLQIDVRSLAPGMYMLRTAAGTARFMKQ